MRTRYLATVALSAILAGCAAPSGTPIDTTPPDSTSSAAAPHEVSLTTKDVHLTLKTKEKDCYGDIVCSVTVQVRMSHDGRKFAPDESWDITYMISGSKDGPTIGTLTTQGETYDPPEEYLSTKSSGTRLTVKVTDVQRNY